MEKECYEGTSKTSILCELINFCAIVESYLGNKEIEGHTHAYKRWGGDVWFSFLFSCHDISKQCIREM